MKYQVLLYYKYVQISNPEEIREWQREICQKYNLKGRIIIATEGINGTVEGELEDTEKYIEETRKNPYFSDLWFKKSEGNGQAFPKLSVKVRNEIVAARLKDDIDPTLVTGKYLSAEELHEWIHSGKKFAIVDMRNDYEQVSGFFKDSILSEFSTFADLPKILPKLAPYKDGPIVTVCTGGVRCEKASGFLVQNGFNDVYQLLGGIVTYMEKYPNEDFLGKLYVFDGRLAMAFNEDDPKREVIGKCIKCAKPSEQYVNCAEDFCHFHHIRCNDCMDQETGLAFCNDECKKKYFIIQEKKARKHYEATHKQFRKDSAL